MIHISHGTIPKKYWSTYTITSTIIEIIRLVKVLGMQKEVCFDTETTGLNAFDAELVGLAISYSVSDGVYVTMPKEFEEAKKLIEKEKS